MQSNQHAEQILQSLNIVVSHCRVKTPLSSRKANSVTPQQAAVLLQLRQSPGTTLRTLASEMALTPSTMSIHIERLVQRGLVERVQGNRDRREIALSLTQEGDKHASLDSELDAGLLAQWLESMGPNERELVEEGLRLLALAARKPTGPIGVQAEPKDNEGVEPPHPVPSRPAKPHAAHDTIL